jgi:hypothetical protein
MGENDAHRVSIAQRSQRPQRGDLRLDGGKALRWTAWPLGGKDTPRGEHRTEVTEEFFLVQVFGGLDKPHGIQKITPIPQNGLWVEPFTLDLFCNS